ncbi:hypothetical protein LN047_22140 [Achromobacter sp. JD417]|uniref:DUF6708 domain-containing protein n=1 Tax=Achromobacter sp. JD417 TaxID=2893881 RepID=UPI0035A60A92
MTSERKRRTVPKTEKSWLYNRVDALRIDGPPLGVAPAADKNFMKMTECCLFMRTASGSLYGGRGSMSWWAVLLAVFFWAIFSLYEFAVYKKSLSQTGFASNFFEFYLHYSYIPFGVSLFVFIACSWIFVPWRRQLPIVFNRKTKAVSFFHEGKVVSEDWSKIEVYIKDVTTASAGGVPINEGILCLVFPRWGLDGKQLRTVIMGTQDATAAMSKRGIYGAAMIWEYIRLFMREGAAAVPAAAPHLEYRLQRPLDAFRHFNPLKMLRVKIWWYPVAVPFFLFVALPLAPVAIIGDLLYYALDRVLPRRKWPQGLIEACEGAWDGRGD